MLRNKNFKLTLIFAAFMFVQLTVLRLGNSAGRGFLSDAMQERVYIFLQLAVILGFLVCILLNSFLRDSKAERALCCIAMSLNLILSLIMLFANEGSAFYLAITGIGVFLLGVTGGRVYRIMSSLCADSSSFGLCLGIGYSAAVLLQFLFQLQFTVKPVVIILLVFSGTVIIYSFLTYERTTNNVQPMPTVKKSKLIYPVVITTALLAFTSYYNSYIHHLQVTTNYTQFNVYSTPRLLMIAGMLILGSVSKLKGGSFIPLCTLCVGIIALLNAVLVDNESSYVVNMCLYYFAITAVIFYYNYVFLRLSSASKHPALWACAGRILDSVIVVLSLVFNFSSMPQTAVIIIDIIALICVIVFMALNGNFNFNLQTQKEKEPQPAQSSISILEAKDKYKLTPTEYKVFCELVQTDDKQEVLAERLNISVSTLRHHITSIYKKTDVQTRAALCKLVFN